MTGSRGEKDVTIARTAAAALLGVFLLASAAGPAGALSFSVPNGRVIEDMDISGTTGDFAIDGDASPESLSITAGVNSIRLDDGSTIPFGANQVTFNLNLMLIPGSLETQTDFFGDTSVTADFSNGLAFDFTVFDNVAGELVFGAELGGPTDPIQLSLTEGFTGVTGTFGAASQGGNFTVSSVSPDLFGHIPSEGNLTLQLGVFLQEGSSVSAVAPLLDGGDPQGFEDFTAQPTGDFNFQGAVVIPEPGSALLLGTVALGAWALARPGRAGRR